MRRKCLPPKATSNRAAGFQGKEAVGEDVADMGDEDEAFAVVDAAGRAMWRRDQAGLGRGGRRCGGRW